MGQQVSPMLGASNTSADLEHILGKGGEALWRGKEQDKRQTDTRQSVAGWEGLECGKEQAGTGRQRLGG